MATFRKRNNKWQVIVRQKDIGTISRSFIKKTQAIKWALEQEQRIEKGVFDFTEPSEVSIRVEKKFFLGAFHGATPLPFLGFDFARSFLVVIIVTS